MFTNQAKLRVVPWDGYLKYYNLGEKHPALIEKRRKVGPQAAERGLRFTGSRQLSCAAHLIPGSSSVLPDYAADTCSALLLF